MLLSARSLKKRLKRKEMNPFPHNIVIEVSRRIYASSNKCLWGFTPKELWHLGPKLTTNTPTPH
jgi:hypothetical protein